VIGVQVRDKHSVSLRVLLERDELHTGSAKQFRIHVHEWVNDNPTHIAANCNPSLLDLSFSPSCSLIRRISFLTLQTDCTG